MDTELSRTKYAFLLTKVLDTPFWAIYNMLPFILYKALGISPFQIALLVALKPLSSFFSLYWEHWFASKNNSLRSSIIWGGIFRHLPFLFFPFVQNEWFFIFCFGWQMTLARGVQPSWMEVLKTHLPKKLRDKTFANGSSIGYLGDALFPFLVGGLLDAFPNSWRYMCAGFALIGVFAFLAQRQIPDSLPKKQKEKGVAALLTTPWKEIFFLLQRRPDFLHFQLGFMLGGSGLMLLQPVLPHYFVDTLKLSYTEIAIALTLCKGAGFAFTSPLWANLLQKVPIYRFTAVVTLVAMLFPLGMMLAKVQPLWIYLSYIGYGIMQAGSTLSWNLSGPIFAGSEDSSLFTAVNIVSIGIRGALLAAAGALLLTNLGAGATLFCSSALCAAATLYLTLFASRNAVEAG